MPDVKFLRKYTVKDEEARTYHPGEIVTMSDSGANHFVARGAAIYYDDAARKNDEQAEAFKRALEKEAAKEAAAKADAEAKEAIAKADAAKSKAKK